MLSKHDIEQYLQEINRQLEQSGETGRILLTGGAAMALLFDARDFTRDVDAVFNPKEDIRSIAASIAAENDLPSNWINSSVEIFIPDAHETVIVSQYSSLLVESVSPETLLAMKIAALRFDSKDLDDALFLLNHLEISTANDLFAILEQYIHPRELSGVIGHNAQVVLLEYQARNKGDQQKDLTSLEQKERELTKTQEALNNQQPSRNNKVERDPHTK